MTSKGKRSFGLKEGRMGYPSETDFWGLSLLETVQFLSQMLGSDNYGPIIIVFVHKMLR
jgi:hypothetical protein